MDIVMLAEATVFVILDGPADFVKRKRACLIVPVQESVWMVFVCVLKAIPIRRNRQKKKIVALARTYVLDMGNATTLLAHAPALLGSLATIALMKYVHEGVRIMDLVKGVYVTVIWAGLDLLVTFPPARTTVLVMEHVRPQDSVIAKMGFLVLRANGIWVAFAIIFVIWHRIL